MPSPTFPEPPPSIPPTPLQTCDQFVAELNAAKAKWVALSCAERKALLNASKDALNAVGPEWVAAACKAKGFNVGSVGEGEEWSGGIVPTMRNLRLYAEAMDENGQPSLPRTWQRPDGQWVAQVVPSDWMEKVLFTGFSAEVWIEPGKEPTQGRVYREKAAGNPSEGGVSLVLGAGNVASIGPMDALYKLFMDDEVVILKMNPVNEYLGPFIERALQPFVDEGFLRVVYGGGEVGAHLCQHPDVHSIHITGSETTHDIIVWGPDEAEAERRKAANDPVLTKPITSELGCVTPFMIVPGPWSEADIEFHARQVASMVAQNASFNCNAAKVLVLAKGWDQRDAFLNAVKKHLSTAPPRKAYYPGAQDRYARFIEHYPNHIVLGENGGDQVVPWTLLPDVPAKQGEYALSHEAFCGVLAVVDIDASDAGQFLDKAVPFCNDEVWGTLSCGMVIHPKSAKAHAEAFDRAVAGLRYGGVAINCWAALCYAFTTTSWGAFPGHPLSDIRSGQGVVHNAFFIDHPQKSVVRAPFRINPTPAWFYDHKNLTQLGQKLVALEHKATALRVPAVAIAALKG